MAARGERTSVFVADDHPIYREGLVDAIEGRPDLELIGEAANGRDALEAIRELAPQVAVLDLSMPELTGFEVLAAIKREELPTRVVILSASEESDSVLRAVAEGALAYVPKDSGRGEVCDAIAAASRGEVRLGPAVQGGLVEQLQGRGGAVALTRRELEVLKLTEEGLSPPEIGFRVQAGAGEVKAHLASACEKLGVEGRAAAVAEASRRGLLD